MSEVIGALVLGSFAYWVGVAVGWSTGRNILRAQERAMAADRRLAALTTTDTKGRP